MAKSQRRPTAGKTTKKPAKAVTKNARAKMAKAPAKPLGKTTAKPAKSLPASLTRAVTKSVERKPEPVRERAMAAARPKPAKLRANVSSIVLPAGYHPSETEPFMSDKQRAYFRAKLLAWKEEIIRQNRETLQVLHEDTAQHADLADRATSETDRALELRARDRQRKLIAKIDAAIARIEDGSYGYCEETGEPIGLKRLDARPIATLSLEAQERHERRERVFRED